MSRDPVAPSPPIGPTTATGLAAMIVGVIVACLSLFDVVPTGDDVQAIGVIVGAVLFVVPYVVMAVSRTKQAKVLATIAADERRDVREIKAAEQRDDTKARASTPRTGMAYTIEGGHRVYSDGTRERILISGTFPVHQFEPGIVGGIPQGDDERIEDDEYDEDVPVDRVVNEPPTADVGDAPEGER